MANAKQMRAATPKGQILAQSARLGRPAPEPMPPEPTNECAPAAPVFAALQYLHQQLEIAHCEVRDLQTRVSPISIEYAPSKGVEAGGGSCSVDRSILEACARLEYLITELRDTRNALCI